MFSVALSRGKRFAAEAGLSVLDAAAGAGILLPYSCKTGRCGACKCRLIAGHTGKLRDENGLSEEEVAAGWMLSCARSAESDLILEADELDGTTLPRARTLPCRVHSLQLLATDVLRVELRLPPAANFGFVPGQYIEVVGLGGVRRSYSLANANASANLLELHIRAVTGGAMTEYWFRKAKVADLLHLRGPLGTFFLRDVADMNLVFLATGTGIAPVKAILEAMPQRAGADRPRTVTVLWGGRRASDLYCDIGGIPGDHRFIPVLSRAESDWSGARGHVQNVLADLYSDFREVVVYACGSNAMIQSSKGMLLDAGLPPNRFLSDAFVCSAPD
jgi:CDP-4-dehydro-6-deoxyglucose reductase, E3